MKKLETCYSTHIPLCELQSIHMQEDFLIPKKDILSIP